MSSSKDITDKKNISLRSSGLVYLSVVIPVYNEEGSIGLLYKELVDVLGGWDYELLFVDDGSTDGSFQKLSQLHEADRRVRVIRFRANCGKAAAYTAGFRAAEGRIIVTMDGDLQDDPLDIPKLMKKLDEGYDLVVGWKHTGKSSRATFPLSVLFNATIRIISGLKINDVNCPLRAFRANVAKSLNIYGDLHRYIPILVHGKGLKVTQVKVSNRSRRYGKPKYSYGKYFRSFFDFLTVYFITKYSTRPLHLFGSLGAIPFGIGFLINLWVVLRFAFGGGNIDEDLPTLLLGVLFIIVGTQLASMGLLGEMLVRMRHAPGEDSSYDVEEFLTD